MKENTKPIVQRLRMGLGAQGFGQAVNLFIRLAEVPLFLAYWRAERYGDWLMVAAIPERGVHLGHKALDSARRHAARVHGDDLSVKASKTPLKFSNDLWHERARAVTRDVDAQRLITAQYGFSALAVALVGSQRGFVCTGQMVTGIAHLEPKGALDKRRPETSRHLFQAVLDHRSSNELVKQFGRNSRQRGLCSRSGLYSHWQGCFFWSYEASNTTFLIGHPRHRARTLKHNRN